jgi:hypothetical protein
VTSPNLQKLTDAELLERAYKLQAEKDAVREEQVAVNTELSRRAAEAALVADGVTGVVIDGVLAEGGG